MTMKIDELSQPLLTPNGPALKREVARAINYIEMVSAAIGKPCDQAGELIAVFDEARAYLLKNKLITIPTKKAA